MTFGKMGARGGFGSLGVLGGASTWVLPGASIDMDFANGRYSGRLPADLTVTRTSSKTNIFPTSISGFAYSTFSSSVAAITPGSGLSVEEARTNVLLNSTAPATQTTASLATGTYTLWVNGSGSATSSAGTATITGAGAATNGSPNVFVVTVAGTVIITVSGSLNAFQCELGTFGTSLIVTVGTTLTRAADIIKLTSMPLLGAAYSMFVKGTPQAPAALAANQVAAAIWDGSANNRMQFYRASATGNSGDIVSSGGSAQYSQTGGNWVQNTSGKIAGATTAGDQQGVFNTTLMTAGTGASQPVSPNAINLGSLGASSPYNGFVERFALWPNSRVSNALLQTITASLAFVITLDGSSLFGLSGQISGLA